MDHNWICYTNQTQSTFWIKPSAFSNQNTNLKSQIPFYYTPQGSGLLLDTVLSFDESWTNHKNSPLGQNLSFDILNKMTA